MNKNIACSSVSFDNLIKLLKQARYVFRLTVKQRVDYMPDVWLILKVLHVVCGSNDYMAVFVTCFNVAFLMKLMICC